MLCNADVSLLEMICNASERNTLKEVWQRYSTPAVPHFSLTR